MMWLAIAILAVLFIGVLILLARVIAALGLLTKQDEGIVYQQNVRDAWLEHHDLVPRPADKFYPPNLSARVEALEQRMRREMESTL